MMPGIQEAGQPHIMMKRTQDMRAEIQEVVPTTHYDEENTQYDGWDPGLDSGGSANHTPSVVWD